MKKDNKKKILKIGSKNLNPEKYVDTKPVMNEARKNTIVISFGRMNPITIGHEKLVNTIMSEAAKRRADAAIYLSHSQDKKKNPLQYDEKISQATAAFGKVIRKSSARTIIEVAKELSSDYDNLVVVVGSDRVQEFENLMNKYNGKEFNFETIDVVSAGERDPDAEGVSGMSASKMRSLASEGKFEEFKEGLPKKLRPAAKDVYDSVRKGMGLNEEYFTEETLEERAPLTLAQRRKRGLQMKRIKSRLKVAREKARRRMASKEKLEVRAKRKAKSIMRNRLAKKPYSEMSPSEKIALDKRLARIPQAAIDRIARKQLPIVKRAEIERLHQELNPSAKNEAFEEFFESYYAGLSKSTADKRRAHFEKGKRMDDDNPAAYKPAPGDARAETKKSYHTKKYHQIFTKEGKVKFDKRFKMYREKINPYFQESIETDYEDDLLESVLHLQETVDNLFESDPVKSLKKKSQQTGISYGILKKVFDRGVAAWRTGHRPGTTPAQWGLARVNSFATGGKTRHTTDSDLWSKHKEKNEHLDSFFEERFFIEQENQARTKLMIAREKAADSEKHKRMIDIAKRKDRAMKEETKVKPFVSYKTPDYSTKVSKHIKHHLGIGVPLKHMVGDAIKAVDIDNDGDVDKFEKRTPGEITGTEKKDMTKVMQKKLSGEVKHLKRGLAFESLDKNDPANREYGTDSLVKILKKDTPGQDLKEYALNAPLMKGDRVRFNTDIITGDNKEIEGTIVGTETYPHEDSSSVISSKGRLRVRDDFGKLHLVRHQDVELIESMEDFIHEQKDSCPILTAAHMKAFEQFVDKMFEKFGIDFEFTKHFRERMSHERNDPCIDMKELAAMIQKIYKKYQHGDKSLNKFVDAEAVIKDLQSNLNMPIAVEYNRKDDELVVIAKTIMRKKNFRTPNPEIKV